MATEENPPNQQTEKSAGRPRISPENQEQRIEFVRSLLRQSRPKGEIRRLFQETFKLYCHSTFQMYYRLAGERNLESLDKPENELLAEAVAYWSRLIQEADNTIMQCCRDNEGYDQDAAEGETVHISGNLELIRQSYDVLDNAKVSVEKKRGARKTLMVAQERIEQNRKMVEAACKRSMEARRELDKILGMHATGKQGRKKPEPNEVSTLSESELHEAMSRLVLEPLRLGPDTQE